MSGRLKTSILILLLFASSVRTFEANEVSISMEEDSENINEKIDKDTQDHIEKQANEDNKNKKKEKSASEKYYDELEKTRQELQQKTKGFLMDLRKNTQLEKHLPWVFYLPFSAIYLFVMSISAILTIYYGLKLICKSADPSQKEIEKVDSKSINQITLEKLTELNQARGHARVSFGQLMLIYNTLNLRTEFEPDDVFSQQTAIMVFQQTVKANAENYTDSQVVINENDNDGFNRMTKEGKMEIAKTKRFQRAIVIMCYLSLIASALALVQILRNLWTFTRILVLSKFDNALLRICFGIIILFITYRDAMQILINLACRLTGAVGTASKSRFMFLQTILRLGVTLLACLAIMFIIFSSPKDDVESIIDQTMNFTALVVLLEIDNILAGVFQKKIDKLEVGFEFNEETIDFEFNRAADFLQERGKRMYYQSIFEQICVVFIVMLLYMVVTFMPIFLLILYVVQPIPE